MLTFGSSGSGAALKIHAAFFLIEVGSLDSARMFPGNLEAAKAGRAKIASMPGAVDRWKLDAAYGAGPPLDSTDEL